MINGMELILVADTVTQALLLPYSAHRRQFGIIEQVKALIIFSGSHQRSGSSSA